MLEITKTQLDIINDPARFKVIVAGRRWGKTHLALYDLLINNINGIWKHANKKTWFISPTYRQSKNIAWAILKEMMFNYPQYIKKKNESELSIELINNSILELKGADNPDSLRGVGLDKATIDEMASMKPDVWGEVLRPALSDRKGTATFIGTPDGFNHFYEFYTKGLNNVDGFKSWHFKSIDSPYLDPDEIEQAKRELDERTFKQEYEATFETAAGRVYYCFDRNLNNSEEEYTKYLPINLMIDFNVNPMMWCVGQTWRNGQEITDHIIDEIVQRNTYTELMAKSVGEKYGFNTQYNIYGDYSGMARSTKSKVTDYDIIKSILPNSIIRTKPNPLVINRINAVNSRLKNYEGKRRLFINTKNCPYLVKDLEQVVWKENTRDIDKTSNPNLTHISDALGYFIEHEYSLKGKIIFSQR